MADTPIFGNSKTCNFPGSGPFGSATSGWDVVYSVSYSAINAHIDSLPVGTRPWDKLTDHAGNGNWFDEAAGWTISSAEIVDIKLTTGGSGHDVRLKMRIANAQFSDITTYTPFPLTDIEVIYQTSLIYSNTSSSSGLKGLVTDLTKVPTVISVTSKPALPDIDNIGLRALMQAFAARKKEIFVATYAEVFERDVAQSVSMPWLVPTKFDYAVSDKVDKAVPDDGIIAVLGKIDGITQGLAAQVNPQFFPSDPDVSAAVFLSTEIMADQAYTKMLNEDAQTAFGSVHFDPQNHVLTNTSESSAVYLEEEGKILRNEETANYIGTKYPLVVPARALTLSFANDRIKIELTGVRVTLTGGYEMLLHISQEYGLVVDQNQNIDLMLIGDPIVTRSVSQPGSGSLLAIGVSALVSVLSIVAGELLPVAIEKTMKFAKQSKFSSSDMHTYNQRFRAAERQARETKQSVSFYIGEWREIIITPEGVTYSSSDVKKLQNNFLDEVTLTEDYLPGRKPGERKKPGIAQRALDCLKGSVKQRVSPAPSEHSNQGSSIRIFAPEAVGRSLNNPRNTSLGNNLVSDYSEVLHSDTSLLGDRSFQARARAREQQKPRFVREREQTAAARNIPSVKYKFTHRKQGILNRLQKQAGEFFNKANEANHAPFARRVGRRDSLERSRSPRNSPVRQEFELTAIPSSGSNAVIRGRKTSQGRNNFQSKKNVRGSSTPPELVIDLGTVSPSHPNERSLSIGGRRTLNESLNEVRGVSNSPVSLSRAVFNSIMLEIAASPTHVSALRKKLQKAGVSPEHLKRILPENNGGYSVLGGPSFPSLDVSQQAKLYKGCARFVIEHTKKGNISSTLYNKLSKMKNTTEAESKRPAPDPAENNPTIERFEPADMGQITIRVRGHETQELQELKPGVFEDLYAAERSERPGGLMRVVMDDVNHNVPRPYWVTALGWLFYGVGIWGGIRTGQLFDDWQSGRGVKSQNDGNQGIWDVSRTNSLARRLFPAVNFSLMEQYKGVDSSGAPVSGPKPELTLVRAGVRGGLILGVNINLN